MTTGEEHGRRALAAASLTTQARTNVIQADHVVTDVKELLEELARGTANEKAQGSVNAIYAAEQILSEAQQLLKTSADATDAYVQQIAPGLGAGPSINPHPAPGDHLTEPPRRRGLQGAIDRSLRASGDTKDLVEGVDAMGGAFKNLEPPPTSTHAQTGHPSPAPQMQSSVPAPSHVDAISSAVTAAVLAAKGVQVGWRRLVERRRRRRR